MNGISLTYQIKLILRRLYLLILKFKKKSFNRHLITLGWSGNLICFKNTSASFEFSWINAPFDLTDSEKQETISIDDTLNLTPTESWKSVEMKRITKNECENYETQLEAMQTDLSRIKCTIINYMDVNELESKEERFPIQFFNLNATEADIQSGALKEQIESERESLEKTFLEEKLRIENIKQIMWDCFETKPQKLQGIFMEIFIQNFPLTDLDEKLSDELLLKNVLQNNELFGEICKLKPWIHPSITIKGDIQWPTIEVQSTKFTDRFSTFASKIVDQQLTANVNLDYNFFSTLPMEPETVDVYDEIHVNVYNIKIYVRILENHLNFHFLFKQNFSRFFFSCLKINFIFQHNIIRLKKLFNDMYVKMSKVKENEMEVLAQRNERLNQIHKDINLLQRLNDHEITKFDPIPKYDYFKDESPSMMLAISSYNIESELDDSFDQSTSRSVKIYRNQSFYKRALDDMMNGVLQVCWEDELKKDPPKPLCVLQKTQYSDLTEAERSQFTKYNEKMTKVRADREKYIQQLFDEKISLETSIELMTKKLNRCVENIIKTKVKAQFAISSEQLKILTCVRDYLKFESFKEKERTIL